VSKQGKAVLRAVHPRQPRGGGIDRGEQRLAAGGLRHPRQRRAGVKITQGSNPTCASVSSTMAPSVCCATRAASASSRMHVHEPSNGRGAGHRRQSDLEEVRHEDRQGVKIGDRGNATLRDCTITDQVGHGVTVESDGKVTVRGGEITKNGKAGMSFQDESEAMSRLRSAR